MVTNKKSLSLQIVFGLGLLTGSTQPDLSLHALAHCYQGADKSYKYLELIFIEQPKSALKAKAQKAQALSLGLTAAAIMILNNIMNKPETEASQLKEATKNMLTIGEKGLTTYPSSPKEFVKFNASAVAGGVLGLILYETYYNYIDQNIKHDTLVKFLQNWNFHSQHVPAELIPAFDELAEAFATSKSKTIPSAQVSEFFAVIQHLIEHEFAKRYEKGAAKSDMLGTLKTLTDIKKNL